MLVRHGSVLFLDVVPEFPGCEFVTGHGIGGVDIYIGVLTDVKGCAAACFTRSRTDLAINGATVDAATGKSCYCEKTMTGSNFVATWRTCQFGNGRLFDD